jgi:hypothetical protein
MLERYKGVAKTQLSSAFEDLSVLKLDLHTLSYHDSLTHLHFDVQ